MSLARSGLAGLAAALVAAALAVADAPPPPTAIAAPTEATEFDLCRTDAGRPAPGPPTWWPSQGRCLPAADDASHVVGSDPGDIGIVLAMVLASAAAAGLRVRLWRSPRGPATRFAASDDTPPRRG